MKLNKKIVDKFTSLKGKLKMNQRAFILLVVVLVGIISFSGYKIFKWHKDNKETDKIMENFEGVVTEVEPPIDSALNEGEEMVNPPDFNDTEDSYWRFVTMPLINVDFTNLLSTNNETVAYIKVSNTIIDYPVVQHADNDYYLTRDFEKKRNGSGWVFADYRDRFHDLKHNTIIYAHGGTTGRMFGALRNFIKKEWYENNDNTVINISTPQENTLWQIFSVYTIPTETYYLTSNFGTDESHQKFINIITSRSMYDFKTKVDLNDKILTLSTCLNDDVKIVVHAKLIKKQVR